ncbi:hypothetical protein G9A89_017862 [Geosiphon pyriformis]|nr:hypothetical protein G9A89_017862 [Geosiphon pyriformis]
MAHLANQAYCSPGNDIGKIVEGGHVIAQQGIYISKREDSDSLVFYFKGKELTKGEWKARKTNLVPFKTPDSQTNPNILVDEEWQLDTLKMWPQIFHSILGDPPDIFQNVYFVGHAIGGAYATLAAQYLRLYEALEKPHELSLVDIQIFTFGAPRIGNKDFARLLNEYSEKDYRVTFGNDHVPHFPTEGIRKKKLVHSETEIWIKPPDNCDCNDATTSLATLDRQQINAYQQAIEYYLCPGASNPEYSFARTNRLLYPPSHINAGENQECNAGQSFENTSDDIFQRGPYFGVIMGECSGR